MKKSFLNLVIRNNYHLFSKSDKKISEYFLQLNEGLINKTIANLSDETGISQTTIFNFVKKLGFDGFQEFKITLASRIQPDDDSSSDSALTVYSDITKEDSPRDVARKIIASNKISLDTLNASLDMDKLTKAINLIENIKFLHFFGLGGSSVVAYDSFHKFLRSKYTCNFIMDYHMQLGYSTKLTNNDAIFIFSHSGETIESINLAKEIKKTDATLIILTGNPGSTLLDFADESIIVFSDESKFRAESLTSRILYLTVMDIIYTSIMYSDDVNNQISFDKIRDAIAITRKDKIK